VLTPIAKFWICKRGSHFAQEAMECLGGNGYVEEGGEGVMARIYREMPLNSIWEGAGNIMALDLLRALRKATPPPRWRANWPRRAAKHPALDRLIDALPSRVDQKWPTSWRPAAWRAGRGAGQCRPFTTTPRHRFRKRYG
jgi:putative acyl-CoA dehydrogenase